MGFMAGFGEGFSRQFAQSQATRAQKEQDAFRLAYSDYVDKKKAYSEADSAWKQAMTKGELMAKKYGLPPEAGLQAAKYIQNGFSDEYVDKLLSQTTYSAPDAGADPVSADPDIQAQMSGSGLAPDEAAAVDPNNPASVMNSPIYDPTKQAATGDPTVAPPNADSNPALAGINAQVGDPNAVNAGTNPNVSVSDATGQSNMNVAQPQSPDVLGDMFKPGGIFQHAGESDAEQAARTVRETAGVSEEEFNKVNAGFQAPEIPDDPNFQINLKDPKDISSVYERYIGKGQDLSKGSFAGAMAGAKLDAASGDPALMKMAAAFMKMAPEIAAQIPEDGKDPKEVEAQMQLLKPSAEARVNLSSLNDSIMVMAKDGKDLIDLAKKFEGAGLTGVGQGVAMFEGFKQEFNVGLQTIQKLIADGEDETTVLGEAERLIADLEANSNGKVTSEIAQNYNELSAKMIRYAYSVGKSYGISGANQSNKEFDIIMKTLNASTNPDVFANNIQDLVKQKIFASETMLTSLSNMAELTIAAKDPNVKAALEPVLTPISKTLKSNPDYAWVFADKVQVGDTNLKVDKTNQSTAQFAPDGKPLIPGYVHPGTGYIYQGGPANDPSSWKAPK